jgi:hypothetical protein
MDTLPRSCRVALVVALATGMAGCASILGRSTAKGQWKAPEKAAQEVALHFRSEGDGRGTIRMKLGDGGEAFEGTYVQVSSDTPADVVQPIILAWAPTWTAHGWGVRSDPWMEGITGIAGFLRHYDGKIVAALEGEQQTMRCRFDLIDPEKGVRGGAAGSCQLSGGGTISVPRPK